VDLKDWEDNIKNVGLDASKNTPSNDYATTVVNFLKGFQAPAGPGEELWDLRRGSRKHVDKERLAQFITKKKDDLFFLDRSKLSDEPRRHWTVVLTTAADALFVYRLLMERNLSSMSLVNVLIDEGIRFHTLQPLMAVMTTKIKPIHVVIPIRVKDYIFGESDYHSYVRERGRLLSSPRGRAALLEGGIVGRIAKEHLGHDRAALGPSTAVTVHRHGFSFADSSGTTYWDDKLTDEEIRNICGSYRCYTGSGSQMSEVSWWPTPTHWNNHNANGFNWGHWTEWDEVWYQQRIKDILSGDKAGVPISQSKWRSKLKGAKAWREITKRVSEESRAFF